MLVEKNEMLQEAGRLGMDVLLPSAGVVRQP